MRSPGDGRPLPPRPDDGLRSGGAPAHQTPPLKGANAPTHKLPTVPPAPETSSPRAANDGAPSQGRSRVYGRERSGGGGGPVRPLRSSSGGSGEPPEQGRGGTPRGPRRRPSGRLIVKIIAAALVALLVTGVGLLFWIDSRLSGIEGVLDDYEGRP